MRNMIGLIILLFSFNAASAQYIVTKVIGDVKKISGEQVKIGSVLNGEEALMFSTSNDLIRAIVAGKGTFIISPSKEAKEKQNKLVEILKYSMHIKSKEEYLSGRGENTETIPDAFGVDARVNQKNLIRNSNKFLFNKNSFDVSNGSRFFLQISGQGKQPIIRPLKTNGDTLIIYRDDFVTDVRDSVKKIKYVLGFFSRQSGISNSVADIDPSFDFSDDMEKIIGIVISQSTETGEVLLQQRCYAEVYTSLGKPSDIDFKNTFDRIYVQYKKQ
ncbi:MAG TPA: hypothetical protein VMT76_17820 [Puia sp.]|nr:hypothetical protein [Puia sp.]